MADLTFSQLEGYWIQAGGSKTLAPLMAAIALAESSGDPNSTNTTDNGGTQTSWGLWQISLGNHNEPSPTWNNPLENDKLAVAKYNSQGLRAWGTYTSGKYKQYMQGGVAPSTPTGTAENAGLGTFLSGIPGWIGGLLTGGTSDLAGIVGDVLGPISNVFQDFDQGFTDMMRGVLWIINPSNWVRIFAGIIGGVALIAGLVLLAQAA
jgi:hypothetical protein